MFLPPSFFEPPNTLYTLFATQNFPKVLFLDALGNMQSFQENLKTILYAKFGEQREGIMWDSKNVMRRTTLNHNSRTDFASNVKRERLNGMKFPAADRLL